MRQGHEIIKLGNFCLGANKSGVIVAKSKQLTVLTATPLGPPVTRLA